jgi:ABC-2 type transport system ATP-binding protein
MNIITGYISATGGSASIAGVDILENPIEAKKHIGYLPEHPPLYLDMTADEYLDFCFDLKGAKEKKREKHIAEICELVGIEKVRHRSIRNLSKGYRQRVGLAQALIGNPDVLILDEPTVGLDPKQIIEIRNVIKGLGKSRTVILSTHILPEVSAVCERVLMISNGVLVADDKPENLAANIGGSHSFIIRVAGPRDSVLSLLKSRDGVKRVDAVGELETGAWDFLLESHKDIDIRKPVFSALAQANFPILMLKPENASLEDIFIRLTGSAAMAEREKSKNRHSKKGGE